MKPPFWWQHKNVVSGTPIIGDPIIALDESPRVDARNKLWIEGCSRHDICAVSYR